MYPILYKLVLLPQATSSHSCKGINCNISHIIAPNQTTFLQSYNKNLTKPTHQYEIGY